MKNLVLKTVLIFTLLLQSLVFIGQTIELSEIQEKYALMAYQEVIELCEENLLRDEDQSKFAHLLANSYRLVNDYEKSTYWYKIIIDADLGSAKDYYHLAQAEKNLENYEEAFKWFKKYDEIEPGNAEVKRHLNHKDYYKNLGQINPSIQVKNMSVINSEANDFGAVIYKDKIVFCSSRAEDNTRTKEYKWDGQKYLDLYAFSKSSSLVTPFSAELNTPFHEGPICFSKDGKTAFFSRNNYLKGKKGKNSNNEVNLKIYQSSWLDGKWQNTKEFAFNNENYSVGHPTVSEDGKIIVFISNQDNALGGTDLYMSKKGIYGWETPENLGEIINTEGNEMFPFLHPDGTLYFSSNGHLGLGGLDVFKCSGFTQGSRIIEHLGAPINSSMDDFSFYLDKSGRKGFLSSNRKNGNGGDDIYSISIQDNSDFLVFSGNVVQEKDLAAIHKAEVQLWSNNQVIETLYTNPDGYFSANFKEENCPLIVKISHGEKWSAYEAEISHCNANQEEVKLGQIPLAEQMNSQEPIVQNSYSHAPTVRSSYSNDSVMNSTSTFQNNNTSSNQAYVQKQEFSDPVRVSGAITGYQSQEPLGGLLLTVTDKITGQTWQTESPYSGEVNLELNNNKSYDLTAQKEGYTSVSRTVKASEHMDLNKELGNKMIPLEKDRTFILENIFYDLGSWTLRSDASVELDKLVKILNENPSMVIELSSHTDSRGSALDNQLLSEKRAMAAVRYILDHGISPYRISGKGYGESKLRNKCSEGTFCPEHLHQENRRTEMTIISY